jgi:hypothetical protein
MPPRTPLAIAAAVLCLWMLLAYTGPGVQTQDITDADGNVIGQELVSIGDDAAVDITMAVRTIAFPLLLLSVAAVEWSAVAIRLRAADARLDQQDPPADA